MMVGISPTRIGGIEILLREVCRQLISRGWRPVLVLEGDAAPVVKKLFAEIGDIELRVFPRQAGLPVGHVPGLWKLFGDVQPELAVYSFNGILRFFPWAARLRGVRRIIYWDQSSRPTGYVPRRSSWLRRLRARLLVAPVSLVTAVAKYQARCLAVEGSYPAERIEVIRNAVPLPSPHGKNRAAAFRERIGVGPEQPLLVQVSWLIPEKGIDIFLCVAREVVVQRPDTHWVVVGEGPGRDQYVALAIQLGVDKHVTFTGSISQPMEAGVFDAATICCQFSQWEEGCPFVVQEAHAAGKPVVASRVGGIPELVSEEGTGYLVERQDVAAASQKILSLLNDPQHIARMGDAARERARTHFELERNVTRLLDAWGASHNLST
jgi:glycosyltransferase involved in cell wall biosynthesis